MLTVYQIILYYLTIQIILPEFSTLKMESRDLKSLFTEMLSNWRALESDKTTDIENSINLCSEISSRIESLSLFSDNEEIEEVSTSSLRFMPIKYFEAKFRLKPHERNPQLESLKCIME